MRSAAHLEVVRESLAATSTAGVGLTTAAVLAHERTLPVARELATVVPGGALRRGSTLAVHGIGATSFALALAGQAVRQGSFLAVVAPPSFGLAACLDFDIPLRRVVQFVLPSDAGNWAQAVAAVIEGFDVVLLADRHRVGTSHARQLVARNRERGSVLVRVGGPAWSDAADLRFDLGAPAWSGLGAGHGHLRSRRVEVRVAGRRHHGGSRSHEFLLPAAGGGVQPAPASAPVSAPALVPVPVAVPQPAAARFAGADIDAMLDVVDGAAASGTGADDTGDEAAAVGWDATA